MPKPVQPEDVPRLRHARVVHSAADLLQEGPHGKVEVEFTLSFEVSPADDGTDLIATAAYGLEGADQKADGSSYFRSEVTQLFSFAGPLDDDETARVALVLVWPYVRHSVQTLATFHGVPLRGVPLILDSAALAIEPVADSEVED